MYIIFKIFIDQKKILIKKGYQNKPALLWSFFLPKTREICYDKITADNQFSIHNDQLETRMNQT